MSEEVGRMGLVFNYGNYPAGTGKVDHKIFEK